jgi:hypothetical protein
MAGVATSLSRRAEAQLPMMQQPCACFGCAPNYFMGPDAIAEATRNDVTRSEAIGSLVEIAKGKR